MRKSCKFTLRATGDLGAMGIDPRDSVLSALPYTLHQLGGAEGFLQKLFV